MREKTFYQMRTEQEVYPQIIPAELREIINSWFDYRYVCDNEFFTAFFKRLLIRDYERYTQLLAIEPGIETYQWLIQNYQERQTQLNLHGSNVTTHERSGTDTVESSRTLSDESETSTSRNTTGSGSDTQTFNKTDTTTGTTSGTTVLDRDATHNRTDSGTVTYNEQTQTQSEADSEANGAQLSKVAPMSVEYSTLTGGVTEQLPPLDWTSATSQQQDGSTNHNEGEDTTTHTGTNTSGGTSASTATDDQTTTDNHTTNGSLAQTGTIGTERTTTGTETGSATTTHDTTDDGTVTTTYGNLLKDDGQSSQTSQFTEQYQGRTDAPAKIMEQAKAFIQSTNAWEWLYRRIDTCFLGVYDV